MQEILVNKLHQYISDNNPDLLVLLEQKNETTSFISNKVESIDSLLTELKASNKPEYIIEESCMDELTKDLRPSKYNYIKNILEEEFGYAYYNFEMSGVLVCEIINIITYSKDVFNAFDFNEENENSRLIWYAVTSLIDEYLSK